MNNKLVLISEFQPLHKRHEEEIINATKNDVAEILFCIDGAYRKLHADSPFSTKEREEMIRLLMEHHALPYSISHLRDSDTLEDRISSIFQLIQPISWKTIISDDVATHKILQNAGIETKLLGKDEFTQSTVRNQFAVNNIKEARKKLPQTTFDYLQTLDTHNRMKKYKLDAFWSPNVAADIIIRNKNWEIAIIERMYEPFVNALPGWMFDWWEDGPWTAARESKEEAGATWNLIQSPAQIKIHDIMEDIAAEYGIKLSWEIQPFTVQTNPFRDPRGHIMTLCYVMDYNGDLGKGSDAKSVCWMNPKEALQDPLIPTAHKELIIAYLAQF